MVSEKELIQYARGQASTGGKMSIREAAQALLDKANQMQVGYNGLLGPELRNLRAALAEKQLGLEELARETRMRVVLAFQGGSNWTEDCDRAILAALQSAVDAAKEEQREADARIAEGFMYCDIRVIRSLIAQAIRGGK